MPAFRKKPKAHPGPRLPSMRLEWQAIIASLLLMVCTVCAISVLQARAGERWVDKELTREVHDTVRMFVRRYERSQMDAPDESLHEIAEAFFDDRHVAFVRVLDHGGATLFEHSRDDHALDSYRAGTTECQSPLVCEVCLLVPVVGAGGHEGLAATFTLWNRDGTPFGTAALSIVDPAYTQARHDLGRMALIAGLSVCAIAIPFVAMGARRLALPLRRLAMAAERLAGGECPEPIPLAGPREIAWVAHSFNRMAASLEEANAALRAINGDLERSVEQRTSELNRLNERLKLELAERAQFFRTISHDLGAPLRNTAGMLTLLRRKHAEALPADASDRLANIAANIDLELDMIRDLLEVSRVGVTEEHPDRVETDALVNELRAVFDHDLRSRRIELVVREPMPVVLVERARLRQVLQNLIDNAIKYMGDSPRRFIDIVSWVDEDGATFCVADTGPGIPFAEHETIFDMFRRASTAPAEVKGSGVGLAAVKGIVERWGGTVHLDSAPGRGSRFVFTVPADRVIAPASENAVTPGRR